MGPSLLIFGLYEIVMSDDQLVQFRYFNTVFIS